MTSEMTRRDFGRTTGALMAASALPGLLRSAGGAPMAPKRDIRKAVKLGMVHGDMPLVEKFELLKRLGFDGVELDSPNGLDTAEVIAARDSSGLPIHGVVDSVHWGKPFNHPDAAVRAEGVKALEIALRDAKAYGGSTVLVVPAVVTKDHSYEQAYEHAQREIDRVLPLAEELDITIAFENVWNSFLLSPIEAARFVDEFESDHVGWYFDVGNIVRFAWPEHWIETLGHRIVKLDIKEYSRAKRDNEGLWKGFAVELIEGDCDWPAVMAALDDIEYRGWATAEVGGGDAERLAFLAERMDRIFAS